MNSERTKSWGVNTTWYIRRAEVANDCKTGKHVTRMTLMWFTERDRCVRRSERGPTKRIEGIAGSTTEKRDGEFTPLCRPAFGWQWEKRRKKDACVGGPLTQCPNFPVDYSVKDTVLSPGNAATRKWRKRKRETVDCAAVTSAFIIKKYNWK